MVGLGWEVEAAVLVATAAGSSAQSFALGSTDDAPAGMSFKTSVKVKATADNGSTFTQTKQGIHNKYVGVGVFAEALGLVPAGQGAATEAALKTLLVRSQPPCPPRA